MNDDNFAPFLIPFKYLSPFKWIYQILVLNEFTDSPPYTCSNPPNNCNPLSDFEFSETIEQSFGLSAALSAFYGIIGFLLIYFFHKIKL